MGSTRRRRCRFPRHELPDDSDRDGFDVGVASMNRGHEAIRRAVS